MCCRSAGNKCGGLATPCVAGRRQSADTTGVIAELTGVETCAVCRATLERDHAFCRVYERDAHITLCSPECVQEYMLASHVNGNGRTAKEYIDQFLAEWRWRELGR